MSRSPARVEVAVVGAGPAGSAMASFAARQGARVALFDMRRDPRGADGDGDGRSINLGLSQRGLKTLAALGLAERVLAHAVPLRGRMIHGVDGALGFQPYGTRTAEVLHSIHRRDLNAVLLDAAAASPGVELHFGHRCTALDKRRGALRFAVADGGEVEVTADLVVGADGVFSAIRQQMHRGERADFHQEFLDWGYRELTLPAAPGGGSLIEWEALHLWPRRESLIVSHANTDGSHTLTLFMPFDGAAASFAGLAGRAAAERYFRHQFGDLAALAPELVDQFLAQPVGSLVSVRTSPWHWRGRAVLVGDACHAVFPFYGQGMNSALEDCLVLHRCLATARSREAALQCYQEERKPHLEALAALTRRNFDELRARVRSPLFVLGKRVDLWLGRLLPGIWQPLYTLVAHTTVPYAEAERRVRRQRRAAALVAGAAAAGLLWWAARRARRGRPRRRPGRDSN